MPYKDPDKQKAYVRKWSREYQRRKWASRVINKEIDALALGLALRRANMNAKNYT